MVVQAALLRQGEANIACACLNVASAFDDDRLERIFVSTAHVLLAHAEELAAQARDMFATALEAATRLMRTA